MIMKKQFVFSLAALILTAAAFGQVENDDMYFNSKDRVKLKSQNSVDEPQYLASAKKTKKAEQVAAEEVVNPTDSYSARNVNPEFTARSNSQTAQTDNQDYFINNYQYSTASSLNNWNRGYSSYYNNSWYGNSYYGPSSYGWASPYYGGYYDTWGNPWCNPYYQSGWSSSFGYSWGSSWNYGWGMSMSYMYGNPYMNSYYPGYGYGYGFGPSMGWVYGGPAVVVVNYSGEYGRNVVYGKRASHGGMVTTPQDASYTRTRTNSYAVPSRPSNTGGRVASTSGRQEDYYNRSWRNSQQSGSEPWNGSSYQRSGSNSRSSSYDPWGGGNSSRSESYSPSRSSYDGGGGSSSRPSAPSSSGSNGRTRGRD